MQQWIAGTNHPGYLPDGEPSTFDSWDAARQAIVSEIEETLNNLHEYETLDADNSDQVIALQGNLMDALELLSTDAIEDQPYESVIGSWCYWIARAE